MWTAERAAGGAGAEQSYRSSVPLTILPAPGPPAAERGGCLPLIFGASRENFRHRRARASAPGPSSRPGSDRMPGRRLFARILFAGLPGLWAGVTPAGAQPAPDPLEGAASPYVREGAALLASSRFLEAARAYERGFRETGHLPYLALAGGAYLHASTGVADPNWRTGMRYVRHVLHNAPTAVERAHAALQVEHIPFPFGPRAGLEDRSRSEGEAFSAELSAVALYPSAASLAKRRPEAALLLARGGDFRAAIAALGAELTEAMYSGIFTGGLVADRDSLRAIQASLDAIVRDHFAPGGDRVRGAAAVRAVAEEHGIPELNRWAAMALLTLPPERFTDTLYRHLPVWLVPADGHEPGAAERDAARALFREYLAAEPSSAARVDIEHWLETGRFPRPSRDRPAGAGEHALPGEPEYAGASFGFGAGTQGEVGRVRVTNAATGVSREEPVTTWSPAASCALTVAAVARALGMDAAAEGARVTFRGVDRPAVETAGGCALSSPPPRTH